MGDERSEWLQRCQNVKWVIRENIPGLDRGADKLLVFLTIARDADNLVAPTRDHLREMLPPDANKTADLDAALEAFLANGDLELVTGRPAARVAVYRVTRAGWQRASDIIGRHNLRFRGDYDRRPVDDEKTPADDADGVGRPTDAADGVKAAPQAREAGNAAIVVNAATCAVLLDALDALEARLADSDDLQSILDFANVVDLRERLSEAEKRIADGDTSLSVVIAAANDHWDAWRMPQVWDVLAPCLETLKAAVPRTHRRWLPESRLWLIHVTYRRVAARVVEGFFPARPQLLPLSALDGVNMGEVEGVLRERT